jgi:hypothetical protein
MCPVVFRNRVNGSETLPAADGQPLVDVLRANSIPVNAVLAYRNGRVVPETTVVHADELIELEQVRHYDLDVVRRPRVCVYGSTDHVYSKTVLFDQDGALEQRTEQLDADGFVRYVEEVFLQSAVSGDTMRPEDHVVIGLSGGRDSVAYLKLLERTVPRRPPLRMTAVTITGLPDWEEPATFAAARSACEALGIAQVIVEADEIRDVFRLRRPFVEVMSEVVAGGDRHLNMVIGHQVLRRLLERAARRQGAATIAFGFNADDLVASLVTWFTSGYRMGGIPVREIAGLRYVFPLYRITKKELTLYLELVAPELTRQGVPGRFTTGTDERSLAYAVADHLYGLWPGIDYYLFEAFATMQQYMFPLVDTECRVCAGAYLLQEGVTNPVDLCDVCHFFAERELSVVDGP